MNSTPVDNDNEKMHEPLVSIIVITYNSSKFVLETLESAKSQTYEKIELIVSDDASSDDTVEICQKWLNKNEYRFVRTVLLTVPINTGIPANCNRGFKISKGEWIKFIAGDDALYEHAIEWNISVIRKKPNIHILFSSMNEFYSEFNNKSFTRKAPTPEIINEFKKLKTVKDQHKDLIVNFGSLGVAPTSFISKDAINNVGGFDERFKHIEDLPMWIKLTKAGYLLHFIDNITVKYRLHDQNIDNDGARHLINPSFFLNETVRKEYIYKNISTFHYLKMRNDYFICLIANKINLSNTKSNRLILSILKTYLNVFWITEKILKKLFRYKMQIIKVR